MEQIREVVVCPQCKGLGLIPMIDNTGRQLFRKGMPQTEPCPSCNGDRVLLKQVTTEYFLLTPNIVEEEKSKKGGIFSKWKKN